MDKRFKLHQTTATSFTEYTATRATTVDSAYTTVDFIFGDVTRILQNSFNYARNLIRARHDLEQNGTIRHNTIWRDNILIFSKVVKNLGYNY